jgi:hypothetical protein
MRGGFGCKCCLWRELKGDFLKGGGEFLLFLGGGGGGRGVLGGVGGVGERIWGIG